MLFIFLLALTLSLTFLPAGAEHPRAGQKAASAVPVEVSAPVAVKAALVVSSAKKSNGLNPGKMSARRKRVSLSEVPALQREFRAAWVATVDNIDWPSKRGLPVAQQKAELLTLLDKAAAMHLNALVFQVRPACDALFESKYEPWSEYLTGQMGLAPEPFYDPLQFAIEEAHKRGIELHAWFNPYRAHHPSGKSPISEGHVSKTHPDLVKQYGPYLWMDPGEAEVQERSLNVILDVVKRYDVDGVHIDDYFYPYKEKGPDGNIKPFPDEPSWQRYLQQGGTLDRENWRRENVNNFIERMYKSVKAEKKWVKVGISPFGIYRPGFPATVKKGNFDQYDELYADARKWLREGWMDYWTPQLYWKIGSGSTSYTDLLHYWCAENGHNRHIWPGSYTSRVADKELGNWPAGEIVQQVEASRACKALGQVHFSMKALMTNQGGLAEKLSKGPYAVPAVVPACPWLSDRKPAKPELATTKTGDTTLLTGILPQEGTVWQWAIRTKRNGKWRIELRTGSRLSLPLGSSGTALPEAVAVSAIDRFGNESPLALWEK